jgi:ketosteroid isomerase-like protein
MTEHSLWRFSRALHRALNERQFADLETLIDDDIDWTIHGPVELFPFFGARQGKGAVLQVLRNLADKVRVHRFDREAIMLGAEQAASMLRYSLTLLSTNKPVRVRLSHFAQFRDGKLSNLRVLVDSYELVEQTFGLPRRERRLVATA